VQTEIILVQVIKKGSGGGGEGIQRSRREMQFDERRSRAICRLPTLQCTLQPSRVHLTRRAVPTFRPQSRRQAGSLPQPRRLSAFMQALRTPEPCICAASALSVPCQPLCHRPHAQDSCTHYSKNTCATVGLWGGWHSASLRLGSAQKECRYSGSGLHYD
jgi:hypothetical protein